MLADNRGSVVSPDDFWPRVMGDDAPKGAEQGLGDIEKFTGFPEPLFAHSETKLREWRQAHRTLVLHEDLRDLAWNRDLGIVDTLAMLLPERVGMPVSINALAEGLQVNSATVKGYLETLSRLYYLFALRPFAGRLTRTLRQAEKISLFEYTEIGNPGPRFENLVAVHPETRRCVERLGVRSVRVAPCALSGETGNGIPGDGATQAVCFD
jgi:predicted AAA+ superfamily ATPase